MNIEATLTETSEIAIQPARAIISKMPEQLESGARSPFIAQPHEWPVYQRRVKRGVVR